MKELTRLLNQMEQAVRSVEHGDDPHEIEIARREIIAYVENLPLKSNCGSDDPYTFDDAIEILEDFEADQRQAGDSDQWWDGWHAATQRLRDERRDEESPYEGHKPGDVLPDGALVTMPDGERMYALGPCGDDDTDDDEPHSGKSE